MIHKGKPRYMGYASDNFDCYIINKALGDMRIPILFSPNSISDNVGATFNQQAIPGGSAPAITYSNTGARTVSIDFFVPIDYLPPGTQFENTEEYLNALRALVYPNYIGAKVKSPNCSLHLTNITLDGVCTQCNISYKADQRYGNDGALGAEVSLSFLEILDYALSNSDVSGKMTVLSGTEVTTYKEKPIGNSNNHSNNNNGLSWGHFKLKGSSNVSTTFKKAKSTSSTSNNTLYKPNFIDEGCSYDSGAYTVVPFYYVSKEPIVFSGKDIQGENGDKKSALYKICIDGESYPNSTKELIRNQMPELTKGTINSVYHGIAYYYIIYAPYVRLDEYLFNKALIRTVVCEGGVE